MVTECSQGLLWITSATWLQQCYILNLLIVMVLPITQIQHNKNVEFELPKMISKCQLSEEGPTCAITLSLKDKLLATPGGEDKKVILYNYKTDKIFFRFDGHEERSVAVCFSPNGEFLASGSIDKTIILWDVNRTKQIVTLKGHSNAVDALAFSPDGKLLASASSGNEPILLWDTKTWKQKTALIGHKNNIKKLQFSNNKTLISVGGSLSTSEMLAWDINDKLIKTVFTQGHKRQINALDISLDNKLILTGSLDGVVKLFEINSGKEVGSIETNSPVWSVAFHQKSGLQLIGLRNGTVLFIDINGSKLLAKLPAHSDWVNSVCFSNDGDTLVTASSIGEIKIWSCNGTYWSLPKQKK